MSHITLLHRDLSRRIDSLKQIIEARTHSVASGRKPLVGEARCTIDLHPNSNQLLLTTARPRRKPPKLQPRTTSLPPLPLPLDEGFESDVDTISLVSTESTISKLAETDSAHGSASSDSDDCDVTKKTNPSEEKKKEGEEKEEDVDVVREQFNLVNCVCYTDDMHPDVLILIAGEETLVFRFTEPAALRNFYENWSTMKAVASHTQVATAPNHFNLLQRTDANGMTHIRISRETDYLSHDEDMSLMSLPNLGSKTLGLPSRRRPLKKSKSIEDFLDLDDKPLRKIWNSAENILDNKPKIPPRRKKGPAPQPPMATREIESLGNVFQGQFVRVQVDHKPLAPPIPAMPALKSSFKPRDGPEILKYDTTHHATSTVDSPMPLFFRTMKTSRSPRNFDAFKFSDPKNLTGYQPPVPPPTPQPMQEKYHMMKGLSAQLKLYIPGMYKSKKPTTTAVPVCRHQPCYHSQPSPNQGGNFTNRLFGMSSKLKEFSSLQSGCNPNKRYEHTKTAVPTYLEAAEGGGNRTRFGRLGRSGSLGSLTLLANAEKYAGAVDSSTLKSVIKKSGDDHDRPGRKTSRASTGKKVTFSAYNTVQVV